MNPYVLFQQAPILELIVAYTTLTFLLHMIHPCVWNLLQKVSVRPVLLSHVVFYVPPQRAILVIDVFTECTIKSRLWNPKRNAHTKLYWPLWTMYFLMMASNVFHQQTFLYKYFRAFLTSEPKSLNRIVLAKLGVMLGITTIRDSRQKCKSKSECHAGHYHHSRIPTEMHTQNYTGPYERCIFLWWFPTCFFYSLFSHILHNRTWRLWQRRVGKSGWPC